MRFKSLGVAVLTSLALIHGASATGTDLANVMTEFKNHLDGTATRTAAQIESMTDIVDANQNLVGNTYDLMDQAKGLIDNYEISNSLFRTSPTFNGFVRTDFSTVKYAQAQFMIRLMQAFMDDACNADNLAAYPTIFDGFNFETAKYFPGNANPPANPNAVYSVQINASQPEAYGYYVLYSDLPARRPTGAYLAPGSIATVTVPSSLVNQGFTIRVGAHTWDKDSKTKYERLDQVSLSYPITSTSTEVANSLGGGIYIEVPYGVEKGLVNVDFKNTVRSPFFSNTVARQTTLAEWQNTERSYPGPWADFESDRCMFDIPRNWIYSYDDPVTMMRNWDMAMDAISDLQGLPQVRSKTILYGQVDTSFKGSAGAPGYPQVNDNWNPNVSKNGDNTGHHYLYGPKLVDQIHLHELGHGIYYSKFAGETEAAVNLPYVAVHNRKFGVDLDEAFGRSVGNEGCKTVTRDQAALMWVLDPDFRSGMAMDFDSMKYQHRGWGKYVEIAALFGWKALGDFWKSEAIDAENGITYLTNPSQYSSAASDNRILRMSRAAGVDLTPLIHFWGVHPSNPTTLKSNIAAEGLLPSPLIYERLTHYRDIVPHTQGTFNSHFYAVNAAPRDNDWYAEQKASYDTSVGTQATAKIQELINLYFPDGRPAELPLPGPVIYSEDFNGTGGALEGKTTTTGGGNWIANPLATDNGVLSADAGSAMLRFDPLPNKIYTVLMDFNYSSGMDGWLGIGFSNNPPLSPGGANSGDRFTGANVPGYAWMIYNSNNTVTVFEGPKAGSTTIPSSGSFSSGVHNLRIVIDTTGDGSTFTANFFVDGASVTGGPQMIDALNVGGINYVGFSQYGSGRVTGSTVDNFSLTTGIVSATEYDSWADGFQIYGNDAAASFDYDNDGASNLLEYSQNGDPTDPETTGTAPSLDGVIQDGGTSWLVHNHVERATQSPGITYTLEQAVGLRDVDFAPSLDAVFLGEVVNGDYKTVTHWIPMDGEPAQFLRMKVSSN